MTLGTWTKAVCSWFAAAGLPLMAADFSPDENAFLERLDLALLDKFGENEVRPMVQWVMREYTEELGWAPDDLFGMAENALEKRLAAPDQSRQAESQASILTSFVAFSDHPRRVDVLERAAFAPWNPARNTATYRLVSMSPETALRLLGRMAEEGSVIDEITQANAYYNVEQAWLKNPAKDVSETIRADLLALLRNCVIETPKQETAWAIEKILARRDPSWRGSAEREALAKRFLATYVPEGKEKRWPELAVKEDAQMTEEGRTNIHNFFAAALADVETARKEAEEKDSKPVEAAQP